MLHYLTIAEAARLIRTRQLSPVELTEAYLERIAEVDADLSCFIRVTPDAAQAAARQAEAMIARGEYKGALHGIPLALKDIFDVAGIPTTAHSRVFQNYTPSRDAMVVGKLVAAGAVLLGKLATHECATGGPSFDLPWPPARNPWNPAHYTGGSSSGSGAAVAAGLCAAALGSDTGGSIRTPAAFCGVAGLKPTYGRVSVRGVLPLCRSLDNVGPLCRSAEDCGHVLQAIAGHDPLDPASIDRPVDDYLAKMDAGLKGLRVGLVRHFYETDRRATDEVVAAMDAAVEVLSAEGAAVHDIRLRPLADYEACFRLITVAEAYTLYARLLRERLADFGEVLRYRVVPGVLVCASDYLKARCQQRALQAEIEEVLATVDVLVTASIHGPAPRLDAVPITENFSVPRLPSPFSVSKSPAISVLNGFSRSGLPLGMQIAGRRFDEATVLRVASAYERSTTWRARQPSLAAAEMTRGVATMPASRSAPRAETRGDAAAIDSGGPCRADIETIARLAGLTLPPRQIDQLCEVAPFLWAMAARLPDDEPASNSKS